ncbi:MAG: hypothetical protein R6X20_03325 [Phycisphaerae bacterium]
MSDTSADPKRNMPADVGLVGGLCILLAIGSLFAAYEVYTRFGGGILFIIWTHHAWLAASFFLAMAAYHVVAATGLFRMRPYGLWMLLAYAVLSALSTPFRLILDEASIPEEARASWSIATVVDVGVSVAIVVWCLWRRRLFLK